MKITKNIFIITATAALLAGCGSTIIPSLSLPMERPESPAAKTAELTEAELKLGAQKIYKTTPYQEWVLIEPTKKS